MIRLLLELQQQPATHKLGVSRISEGRAWHQGSQGVTSNNLVCQLMARDRHGARGEKNTLLKKVENLLQCPTGEGPCPACPQPAGMVGDGQMEGRDLHKPLLSTLS